MRGYFIIIVLREVRNTSPKTELFFNDYLLTICNTFYSYVVCETKVLRLFGFFTYHRKDSAVFGLLGGFDL